MSQISQSSSEGRIENSKTGLALRGRDTEYDCGEGTDATSQSESSETTSSSDTSPSNELNEDTTSELVTEQQPGSSTSSSSSSTSNANSLSQSDSEDESNSASVDTTIINGTALNLADGLTADVLQDDRSSDGSSETVDGEGPVLPIHQDIQSRLASFLPQLARANERLTQDSNIVRTSRVDDVPDDAEHYIEMNLGLGVLSEKKRPRDDEIHVTGPDTDEGEDSLTSSDESDNESLESESDAPREVNVMARLRGEGPSKRRRIEELG